MITARVLDELRLEIARYEAVAEAAYGAGEMAAAGGDVGLALQSQGLARRAVARKLRAQEQFETAVLQHLAERN